MGIEDEQKHISAYHMKGDRQRKNQYESRDKDAEI